MYQALYRTYRPKTFGEVIGQDHAVKIFRQAIALDRVGHAYLLSGPKGIGKTTLAKIVARAVNCAQPKDGEPCFTCEACTHEDLHTVEIDAASNRGIDEIRELRERARFLPAVGRRKVYIVDEVHMLTAQAANALLKTLEEPPDHILFLMATTEPEKMPATLLSRCLRVTLRPQSEAMILEGLQRVASAEQYPLPEEVAEWLSRRAGGSLRDGLALLDLIRAHEPDGATVAGARSALGSLDSGSLEQFFPSVKQGPSAVLAFFDEAARGGVDFHQLAKDLLDRAHQAMTACLTGGPQGSVESLFPARTWVEVVRSLLAAMGPESRYGDQRLALELAGLRLSEGVPGAEAAPAPAHQPKPEAKPRRTTPPPKALDLEALRGALHRTNKAAEEVLSGVEAALPSGDEVVLAFSDLGRYVRASQEDMHRVLSEAISEMVGGPVKVSLRKKEMDRDGV